MLSRIFCLVVAVFTGKFATDMLYEEHMFEFWLMLFITVLLIYLAAGPDDEKAKG